MGSAPREGANGRDDASRSSAWSLLKPCAMRVSTFMAQLGFFLFLGHAARAEEAAPADRAGGYGPPVSAPSSESPWAVSAIALATPYNHDPSVTDGHSLGDARAGAGMRVEGRYRPVSWFGLALGADYYQAVDSLPARHLALPLRFSLIPLHTGGVELGAGLGIGPAFSWYPSYASTLHARGIILEARVEGAVALDDQLSLLVATGARIYGEGITDAPPGSYAAGGFESPAAAIDFGLGLRWRL